MSGRAATAAGGALLAALALLGAGCSAGSGSGPSAADKAVPGAARAQDSAAGGAAKEGGGRAAAALPGAGPTGAGTPAGSPSAAATAGRSIAYTAELELEAADVAGTLERLHGLVTGAGGYVSSETASGQGGAATPGGDPQEGAQLVAKVPAAAFDRTLAGAGRLGRVLRRHREAEDVTDRVVDVESRLRTQRASVARVRALMDRAAGITDVVALEAELGRREADLESLERQQQELASRTALSTLTVDLVAPSPDPAAAPGGGHRGFWASAGHALGAGWHALYVTARGLLVCLAAVAPFALVLAPAGWLAVRLARRRRAAGRVPAAPPGPVEPAAPAGGS
ncbi:DUF4349 domain-containing protein [Streptacidiphilus sp. ASG 303]|uniref:DUF4349 domain-containing protein n=1 Tax=Streptacidiphilus sp. ASG 303 TaxID=2896847 RepID=UPI001E4F5581|nr:DUF4349 domain-containing protein [Streptacidiphilus sp. ASG 303]MCD0483077.1 DUF4349 domain-containing protein [Streptacidiphilus sp. ASG 303]